MPGTDALVIIPTYNEADNIESLLEQLLALPVNVGVIVVDDNSPDGTGDLVEKWARQHPERVHGIHRPGKLGFGTAHIAGFKKAMELGVEHILTMDADFSHHPRYIPAMLDLAGQADVVIGSRYIEGGGAKNCTWKRVMLSKWANSYARLMLGLEAHDATAGFRLYHRAVLASIPLDSIFSSGYSFLIEMLFMCQQRGWRVGETPIIFEDRRAGKTKISRQEIFKAQYTVLRLFLRRLRRVKPVYPEVSASSPS